MTVTDARERAAKTHGRWPGVRGPKRTCFACDGRLHTTSTERRVYCAACRRKYGFPAPDPAAAVSTSVLSGQTNAAEPAWKRTERRRDA